MSGVENGRIVALAAVEARVEPFAWPFLAEREAEIARHWAKIGEGKKGMFDGRVLLQHRARIEGDIFRAAYFETNYSAFMAWRDFGHPGPVVRNGFGMAALRAADGGFLCGRMGRHTSNPGKVYFAAGTPDRDDVRPDGRLDLAGSVARELQEETGLQAHEFSLAPGWTAVIQQGRIAFMRAAAIAMGAQAARALMLERIARQDEPELDDIVIIRNAADAERHDMAPFMRPYLDHIWARD